MLKKARGFTLIELLIVVAIIGILAALLIPNAITAIQKSKQKGTMKDIVTIATGAADFITDQGSWDNAFEGTGLQHSGPLDANDPFITALSPFYVKVIPQRDQWGTPYQVYLSDAVATVRGINAEDVGSDDFLIESFGRDGDSDGVEFNPENATAGMYTVTQMSDFNFDLVNWSGSWIRAPRTAIY